LQFRFDLFLSRFCQDRFSCRDTPHIIEMSFGFLHTFHKKTLRAVPATVFLYARGVAEQNEDLRRR